MPLGFAKLLKGLGGGRVHEAELQPGSTVKAYGIVKRLGSGQFAVVSSASHGLLATGQGHFFGRRARLPECPDQHGSRAGQRRAAARPQGQFCQRRRRRQLPSTTCVHSPPPQVYKVQATDGHLFALKQERFDDMSESDRRVCS